MRAIKCEHKSTEGEAEERIVHCVFISPISMRFGEFHGQKGAMRTKVKVNEEKKNQNHVS